MRLHGSQAIGSDLARGLAMISEPVADRSLSLCGGCFESNIGRAHREIETDAETPSNQPFKQPFKRPWPRDATLPCRFGDGWTSVCEPCRRIGVERGTGAGFD